ncbi:MAG TPA: M48 family metalloprotease [Pyrinomonadaceae bacterium]|nr:M48 family metalloprotease [Pyrinomonadaceae bacterium]
MPIRTILSLLLLVCVGLACVSASAQDCKPPAITANSQNYNIFTPEQEMILGELNYQRMAGETRYLQDEKLLAYVRDIGDRLVRHMPPTGLKFQFFIIDIPDANAFNTPGGYVFISRKLIAFTKTEDELAGVMAHELGHAAVRHSASDMSELFKKILNITQLGDRKDITDKFNLLIERERTKSASRGSGHESAQQLEADRIGLFAMVAAGYDPNAFPEFFARLTEAKAKSGNWFTNIFGGSSPTDKRLREMIKATELLPAACRDNRSANASQQFLNWQAEVVSFRQAQVAEELPGLMWKRELAPQLKSDIWHVAIAGDGKYFLAQDDFAITLIQREPVKVAFQIPTTDARPASFTPDNKFVVFGTDSLRFEKWSIADAKPVEVRELVVRRDCWEQEFSADGKYLACVDYNLGLSVLETQTGKRVFQKKEFAKLNLFELLLWIVGIGADDDASHHNRFFNLQFSPDSHYLLAARSNMSRVRIFIDSVAIGETDALALDLSTGKQMSPSGDLKKATRGSFIFLTPEKILATVPTSREDAGIFTFPEGKRIAKFSLSAGEMKRTSNPNYVIVKSFASSFISFFDLERGELIGGFNKSNVALWNDVLVSELVSGNVSLSTANFNPETKTLRTTQIASVDIPVGSMNRIYAANVSDNMQWLAVSSKTRGAVWDLNTGERKLHVRGFRGALVAANGTAIGDFPKLEPVNHSLVHLDAAKSAVNVLREIPERGARQYGRFVLVRTSLKTLKEREKEKAKEKEKPKDKQGESEEVVDDDSGEPLNREVRFELHDIVNDKVVWTKDFPKEAPGYFFDDFSGRVILYWSLGSEAGKARLKEDQALVERSRQMGNKDDDYVLEIFDAFENKSVGTLLLETGKGSFDIESGFSEGNWLVLRDDNNRVLVYSIKDGELRHRFFGANAAVNPRGHQIVVQNYPGELTIYDMTTGNASSRLRFKTPAAFTRFSLDGKRLLVLTAGQVAYAFDADKITAK